MKFFWLSCLLVATLTSTAQPKSGSLSANGGRFVGFDIDGETRVGQAKIYPASTPYFNDDDWFVAPDYPGQLGKGVIDTSGASVYKTQLQAGKNISFTKRMIGQPYDIGTYWPAGGPTGIDANGKPTGYTPMFKVDGCYFRDYYANDSTAFTSANKNGQNPNNWTGGYANTGAKSDIIDAMAHVRTSGINPFADSVWFFAGVATKNTTGERYFDIEVYREKIYFNRNLTGAGVNFVSTGTDYGHSRWILDNTGKVTNTGDLIISVSYKAGTAPDIDFRIWIKKTTYDSIQGGLMVPQTFKLNGRWDVADDGVHGYAEITAPNSTDIWGSGLGNYTGVAASDTAYSTPWGTVNTSGTWSQNYDQLQFVEIGLNFSRFGMNPFQYVTSFCKSPYASIMVKSRSSTSFSANLDDFVGPIDFSIKNVVDFNAAPENLTCIKDSAKIQFTYSARNYYRILNSAGDTLYKDIDFRTAQTVADQYLKVGGTGNYKIEATNFMGCPAMSSKTVTVTRDNIAPTASILIGSSGANYKLIGNGTTPSSSYGASTGYTYSWTGPAGSVITMPTDKEPVITTFVPGQYNLTVTENRNGCTDGEVAYLWVVLSNNKINLQAQSNRNDVVLKWLNPDAQTAKTFEIQRSYDQQHFETIGSIKTEANSNNNSLSFTDINTLDKQGYYRIKFYSGNNAAYFSNIVHLTSGSNAEKVIIYKYNNAVNLSINNVAAKNVLVNITDVNGRLLSQKEINTSSLPLSLSVNLPANMQTQAVVVTVLANNQVIGRKKLF